MGKDNITEGILQTFQKEFPDLKISDGFAKEIKTYMDSEPKDGYGLNDCYDIINKISHVRKVDSKVVAREVFYLLLGQYLVTKYGKMEKQK